MGIWLNILVLGARGDSRAARELLALELPLALRDFAPSSRGSREYLGELPKAVRRFISGLSDDQERALARSLERELTDYIVDDVVTGVEKPLLLTELCLSHPGASLDELAAGFPWEEGLKRDAVWKRRWIADCLRSMLAAEVPLLEPTVTVLGNEGEPRLGFNEIAFAVAPERLKLSWNDFKKRHGYNQQFLCISETETDVSAEGFDYGSITMAEIVLQDRSACEREMEIDLHLLGKALSQELPALMEEMHTDKPFDGYRPIAWHNVFWNLTSEYVRLHLTVEIRDPFRETDQELADHLAAHYLDVTSASRPVILRRRKKLHAACDQRIQTRFWERFAGQAEQISPQITHVD